MPYGPGNYETLFNQYRDDSAILRMEKYALWSLPTVFARTELRNGKQEPVERDYQSIGAMLTNTLASKITELLFPSNQSFFRLDSAVNPDQMASALATDTKSLASGLADLENTAYRRIFLKQSYHQLMHAIKLLIVTGNALVYRDSTGTNIHTYSLRQYSVQRDGSGKIMDIILKERTSPAALPVKYQHLFKDRDPHQELCLYTRIQRMWATVTDTFHVSQCVENHMLDTNELYPEAICPYIPVTWNLITGENNGRGLVEDYAGDFAKLSELSEALALYEIETCRVLHMAKPGSGVDVDSVAETESGGWVSADPSAVEAYEAGDANKIEQLMAEIQAIFQRLAPAFMYGGNTRDAERVTAEEIRMQADEANRALGGVYSAIADNLHIPLAHILCNEVNPDFIKEILAKGLTLSVLTGVAALGRSSDVTKLLQVAQVLSTVMPVLTQTTKRINPELVIQKVFEGFGLNLDEYAYTEEELETLLAQTETPTTPVNTDVSGVASAISEQGVL
jgi:hypothetical protein